MKKGDKFILLALVFVALMILATMGYRVLSEQYAPQDMKNPAQLSQSDSEATANGQNNAAIPPDDTSANGNSAAVSQTPDFTVYDMDGNAVKLSDYFGKPIIVNFWATWCGPCKSELPAFNTMYAKYKDDVHFLMVNLTDGSRDTKESVTAFVNDGDYTFPVYFDTTMEAAYTYSAYSIPMTLLITSDGQLAHTQMGAMSEETLEQYIQTLIKISKENKTE